MLDDKYIPFRLANFQQVLDASKSRPIVVFSVLGPWCLTILLSLFSYSFPIGTPIPYIPTLLLGFFVGAINGVALYISISNYVSAQFANPPFVGSYKLFTDQYIEQQLLKGALRLRYPPMTYAQRLGIFIFGIIAFPPLFFLMIIMT